MVKGYDRVSAMGQFIPHLKERDFLTDRLIRKSSVIQCKRKIKTYLYTRNYNQLYKFWASWYGHIKWADTYNLRQYIRKKITI